MPSNNSLGHQYLPYPFMPQLSVPFVSHLSQNTLDTLSTIPRDQFEMHQAHSNMMHNRILNGMDGGSGMAVGTFDVRPGLDTFYDGMYGPRMVSGTAQFENSNLRDDPEEHYANDIEM